MGPTLIYLNVYFGESPQRCNKTELETTKSIRRTNHHKSFFAAMSSNFFIAMSFSLGHNGDKFEAEFLPIFDNLQLFFYLDRVRKVEIKMVSFRFRSWPLALWRNFTPIKTFCNDTILSVNLLYAGILAFSLVKTHDSMQPILNVL